MLAEMLTTMYDASLDQFKPHAISVPALWNSSAFPQLLRGDLGFNTGQGYNFDTYYEDIFEDDKDYDQLNLQVTSSNNLVRGGEYAPKSFELSSNADMNAPLVGRVAGVNVKDLTGSVSKVSHQNIELKILLIQAPSKSVKTSTKQLSSSQTLKPIALVISNSLSPCPKRLPPGNG
ncbi:MAG: hypothetical protein IPP79_16845 [Chitinophagaceae bacterium]|nr:hypothetical protein [Chitinophagaceae bacterium]